MARRAGQIPLDDEPMEIDLGDLPSDDEFAQSDTADENGDVGPSSFGGASQPAEQGPLALFQLWITLVAVGYAVIGWGVALGMAMLGAAGIGLAALTSPGFYLIMLFWPIALWQLFFKQL